MAGIDPGTVSIDVCALDDGDVLLDASFRSPDLALDPAPLVDALLDVAASGVNRPGASSAWPIRNPAAPEITTAVSSKAECVTTNE